MSDAVAVHHYRALLEKAEELERQRNVYRSMMERTVSERDAALAECEKLRAALLEACAGWGEYAEDTHRYHEHVEWPELQMRRIAELRALATASQPTDATAATPARPGEPRR